jgi:hypothetical protein
VLSLSSVGQSKDLSLGVSVIIYSGREDTVIYLLEISDAETELPGCCDMSWLAEEQVFRRVTIKFPTVFSNAIRIVLPQ